MDTITFRFLISLVAKKNLDIRLMDAVTTYLYGSLDNNIYMKILEGYKMPETYNPISRSMYSIKLQRSLYGLKQFGRMWYNCLSEYILKEGFENNPICPCVFIKKIRIWIYYRCSICWWFKSCGDSRRVNKNNKLFKEWIWDKRSW